MSLRSAGKLGLAVLLAVSISACAAGQPRRVAPNTPLDQQCESVPDGARRLVLSGSDGVALGAAVLGPQTADVGVVIAYGASQTLCEWLGIAGELAGLPAQVLILDRRGRGSSDGPAAIVKLPDDLLTALAWQQAHGVGKVAVLGSSLGSAPALVAGSDPRACAAIGVSPLTRVADGSGSVTVLDVPAYSASAWLVYEQDNDDIRTGAEAIAAHLRSIGSRRVEVLAIPGSDHSRQLVLRHPEVLEYIRNAIRSCA